MIFQISDFETRSLPALPRSYPRHFTFYVAHPIRSIQRFSISIASLFLGALAFAQTGASDDNESIKKTALDYIEGWYAGDAARMERALHPELAKRMISTDPKTGRSQFNHMGAMTLVQRTRDGGGTKTPEDRQLTEVTILDRFNNAAVVKIVASDWVDYLEVAKFNGDWKIINVLWELKPKAGSVETSSPVQKP